MSDDGLPIDEVGLTAIRDLAAEARAVARRGEMLTPANLADLARGVEGLLAEIRRLDEVTVERNALATAIVDAAIESRIHYGNRSLTGPQLILLAKHLGEQRPIPMRIVCPECGELHLDEGVWATKVHHTHSCQKCGLTWRPAVVPTVGVRFLPGFRNEPVGTGS